MDNERDEVGKLVMDWRAAKQELNKLRKEGEKHREALGVAYASLDFDAIEPGDIIVQSEYPTPEQVVQHIRSIIEHKMTFQRLDAEARRRGLVEYR